MAREFKRPKQRVLNRPVEPGFFSTPVLKSAASALGKKETYKTAASTLNELRKQYQLGTQQLRSELPEPFKPAAPIVRGVQTGLTGAREIIAGGVSLAKSANEAFGLPTLRSEEEQVQVETKLLGRPVKSIQEAYVAPTKRLTEERGSGSLEALTLGLGAAIAGVAAESPFGAPTKQPLKEAAIQFAKETSEDTIRRDLTTLFPELKDSDWINTLTRDISKETDPKVIERNIDYGVTRAINERTYNRPQVQRVESEQLSRLPAQPDPGTVRVAFTPATGKGGQSVIRLDANRPDIIDAYRLPGRPVTFADIPEAELKSINETKAREGVFQISNELSNEAQLERVLIERDLLSEPEFTDLPDTPEITTDRVLRAVDENAVGTDELGAPIAGNLEAYGRSVGSTIQPNRAPLAGFASPVQPAAPEPRSFRRPGDVVGQARESYTQTVTAGGRRGGGPGTEQFVKEGSEPRPTVAQETGNLFDTLLTPISSQLERINPQLKNVLRKFEFVVAQRTAQQSEAVLPLLRGARRMSPDDRSTFDLAVKNGDKEVIDELTKRYGLEKEMQASREVLDDLFKRAQEVGMEIKFRENYFPRVVKNPQAFLSYLRGRKDWGNIQKEIMRRAEAKGIKYSDLDVEERAAIVNNIIRGYGDKVTLSRPGFTQKRTIEIIDDELNQFYEPFDTALTTYIIRMNDEIEGRKFFGKQSKVNPKDINTRDSIGAYVLKLIEEGKIQPEQEQLVSDIFKARFSRGKMNGALDAYRNLTYMTTMGSPISAITQIGDIAFSLYENGWYNTAKGIGKTISRTGITKEDLGIERISQEFSSKTKTGKALEFVFKAVGLNAMDRLGKETLVNGQFSKLKSQAKNNDPELLQKLNLVFEDEAPLVLRELQEGAVTENTKLLTFNTLLDFQPVAKSEMPIKYLEMPNGRIFYMLKSFTMKQIDVFRREALDDIASGKTDKIKKGMKNLVYLSGMFMLANATADEMKDTVLGRETSLADRTIDNIARLFGATKYDVYKAREEGIGKTVMNKILFPTNIIDYGSTDIERFLSEKTYEKGPNKGERYKIESTTNIPIGGKLYYWWFGRGAQKQEQQNGSAGSSSDIRRSFSRPAEVETQRSFTR